MKFKKIGTAIFFLVLVGFVSRTIFLKKDDTKILQDLETEYSEYNLSGRQLSDLVSKGLLSVKKHDYSVLEAKKRGDSFMTYKIKVVTKNDEQDEKSEIQHFGIVGRNLKSSHFFQFYDRCLDLEIPFINEKYDTPSSEYYDINKDRIKELIISCGSTVTGWLSNVRIIEFNNEGFKNLTPELGSKKQGVKTIRDIDSNGLYELVVLDSTWEFTNCTCHAAGIPQYFIYSWNGEKYEEKSQDYSDFYEEIITKEKQSDYAESIFSNALTKYFAYKQVGNEEKGWEIFIDETKDIGIDTIWPIAACRDHIIKLHDNGKKIIPPDEDDLEQLKIGITASEEKEISEEPLITEEEFNNLLTEDIKTQEKTVPEKLEEILFEKLKSFCDPEDLAFQEGDIIEGEVANLDEDEIDEFIITPVIICGQIFRGASGNGPFYIYNKLVDGWELIGELEGNDFAISDQMINGYHDINTNYHMSAGSGTVTTYQFSEKRPGLGFFYNSTKKQDYNFGIKGE